MKFVNDMLKNIKKETKTGIWSLSYSVFKNSIKKVIKIKQ